MMATKTDAQSKQDDFAYRSEVAGWIARGWSLEEAKNIVHKQREAAERYRS